MPRIDDEQTKQSFKKRKLRSWDSDLLNSLKLSSEKTNTNNLDSDLAQNERSDEEKHFKESHIEKQSQQATNIKEEYKLENSKNKVQGSAKSNKAHYKSPTEAFRVQNKGSSQANKAQEESPLEPNKVQYQGSEKDDSFNPYSVESAHRNLSTLKGIKLKVFLFILSACQQNDSNITGYISSKEMDSAINLPRNSRETAIKRLQKSGLVIRCKGKSGGDSYLKFKIPQEIFPVCLGYFAKREKETRADINGIISGISMLENQAQQSSELGFNSSIYSSSNINTTTKKGTSKFLPLPDDWEKIDFSCLEEIGFSKTQLIQLVDKNLPEIVQESINYFSYFLEHERNKYPDPLNVFMGVLRKGQMWTRPKGYESPKDKALREYTELSKQRKKERENMIQEIINNEFDDWLNALTDDEVNEILPDNIRKSRIKTAVTATLRMYFKESVLIPKLKNEGVL